MKSPRSLVLMFPVGGRPSNCRFKLKWSMACWTLFLAGLLIQLASPRLKIEHNQFVIPGSVMSANHPVSPSQIVARERWMQLLSATLTAGQGAGIGGVSPPRLPSDPRQRMRAADGRKTNFRPP